MATRKSTSASARNKNVVPITGEPEFSESAKKPPESATRTAPQPEPNEGQQKQPASTADREEQIRQRAHEIWQARGGQGGSAEEDWRLAEAEILGITGGG